MVLSDKLVTLTFQFSGLTKKAQIIFQNFCIVKSLFYVCLIIPLKNPVTTTINTVARVKAVKMLFNIVDFLTLIIKSNVNAKIKKNAKKSGYSDEKGTSNGIIESKVLCNASFVKASM